MATKVITVDDIDGYEGADVAKRDFEIGAATYSIDLGDANFGKLNEALAALAPFLEKAVQVRQAGLARKSTTDRAPRLHGYTNSDVRQWANSEGIDVNARGKIADEVYEQFLTAHPDARLED